MSMVGMVLTTVILILLCNLLAILDTGFHNLPYSFLGVDSIQTEGVEEDIYCVEFCLVNQQACGPSLRKDHVSGDLEAASYALRQGILMCFPLAVSDTPSTSW
jgi:hypothetical protein